MASGQIQQERKLLADAQQTFQDSKTKIEQIRMEMLKLSQVTGAPGSLQVRLVGCEDLLEKISGRSRVATSLPVSTSR